VWRTMRCRAGTPNVPRRSGKHFYVYAAVVAETFDGELNDTFGQHLKPEQVFQALDALAEAR